MGHETRKLTEDIIDLGRLIVVSVIMIALVFLVIKSFIGDVPAYVATALIGLGGVFLYATNESVRTHIKNWLKKDSVRDSDDYMEVSKNEFPPWVLNKWKKIKRNHSTFELENKKFHFKGKNYRYLVKTGLSVGSGGTSSAFHFEERYFKRKRG